MGVPSTDDPARKLGWAQELVENQDRPIPAERLIRESIDIYQEQKDEMGLARAYRVYGIFFKDKAINKWQKFYQETGFLDKSATYETRFPKALEYFEKSLSLSMKNEDIDMPPNLYLLIAFTYQNMRQPEAACLAFDKSISAHKIMLAESPEADPKASLPKQYSSFEEAVNDFKKRAGCKS